MLFVAIDDRALVRAILFPKEIRILRDLSEQSRDFSLWITSSTIESANQILARAAERWSLDASQLHTTLEAATKAGTVLASDHVESIAGDVVPQRAAQDVCNIAVAAGCHIIVAESSSHLLAAGFFDNIPVCANEHLDALLELDLSALKASDNELARQAEQYEKDLQETLKTENITPLIKRGRVSLPSDSRPEFKALDLRVAVLERERERREQSARLRDDLDS